MILGTYVSSLQNRLAIAAEAGGDEARELAARLTAPLESAIRLEILDALSAAADEITRELAPGSVDVRLRGGEPEFVVIPPPSEDQFSDMAAAAQTSPAGAESADSEEGNVARLNLRLPETLKRRIEDAAAAEGLSLNAWLVRSASASLDSVGARRGPTGGDRFTGWVR
jgi:hypothetical protein